jgi:hypothetical protein
MGEIGTDFNGIDRITITGKVSEGISNGRIFPSLGKTAIVEGNITIFVFAKGT